jgi:hypothetical protein
MAQNKKSNKNRQGNLPPHPCRDYGSCNKMGSNLIESARNLNALKD